MKRSEINNVTYYVDTNGNDRNNGISTSTPWKTLTKVNGITFNPGNHILFKKDCTWTGQLMPMGLGSSGSPIVIDQYGAGTYKPKIDGQGTLSNDGAVVRLYNQQYWEISNLDITNNSTTGNYRSGILVLEKDYGTANHIYVKNCKIHDIRAVTDMTTWEDAIFNSPTFNDNVVNKMWGNSSGIDFRCLKGNRNVATKFDDIVIDSNEISNITNYGHGISLTSEWSDPSGATSVWGQLTYSTNVSVTNNLIYDIDGFGAINLCTLSSDSGTSKIERNVSYRSGACAIWIYVAKGVLVQYNEVYDNVRRAGGNDCGAFDADGLTDGNIFQYNYSRNNDGEPYMFCNTNWETWHSQNYCKNNIVRYNLSEGDGKQSNRATFLQVAEGSNNNYVYNNTVYIPSGRTAKIINYVSSNSDNNTFNNNIIYNNGSGDYDITGTGNVFDYNNFYGTHPANEPLDAHKVTTDPKFVTTAPSGGYGMSTIGGYKIKSNSSCKDS